MTSSPESNNSNEIEMQASSTKGIDPADDLETPSATTPDIPSHSNTISIYI